MLSWFPVVNCPALDQPDNGILTGNSVTFGFEVTYTCNTGYTLSGAATRVCQADGNWTGSAPVCNSKSSYKDASFFVFFFSFSLP